MERSDYAKIYMPPPLRPHLEQVEHRHYPAGLSSAHALPSGCELSGEIAIESTRGASIAIAAFPVSFVELPRGKVSRDPTRF